MTPEPSWPAAYRALIERLPELVRDSRLTMGGFSACVDVYLTLRAAAAALRPDAAGTPAAALLDALEKRALSGVGGELAIDWAEGPAWIDRRIGGRRAVGGTSVQAATMLAMLGAPVLAALEDRSAAQLAVIHPDVLVATEDGAVPVAVVRPHGAGKPAHYIFEYTAGDLIAGGTVPRSSRTIVRFSHSTLERDPEFVRLSTGSAATAGAGIVCGFNEMPPAEAAADVDYAAAIVRLWREAGLRLVHMELGDFHDETARALTVERLMPAVTSLGMSLSELLSLAGPDAAPAEAALAIAEDHGLDRVCIHADDFAFAVTRGDPERETEALMAGCLFAATRAASGYFAVPTGLPDNARLTDPSLSLSLSLRRPGWSIACCPAPYLERPAATIGLGDTFLAGTLLVLGGTGASETRVPRREDAIIHAGQS